MTGNGLWMNSMWQWSSTFLRHNDRLHLSFQTMPTLWRVPVWQPSILWWGNWHQLIYRSSVGCSKRKCGHYKHLLNRTVFHRRRINEVQHCNRTIKLRNSPLCCLRENYFIKGSNKLDSPGSVKVLLGLWRAFHPTRAGAFWKLPTIN